jgi:hypothetical protein
MTVPICVSFYLLFTAPTCSSVQPRGWPVPLMALQLHLHGEVTFESTLQEQVWQREGHQTTQSKV